MPRRYQPLSQATKQKLSASAVAKRIAISQFLKDLVAQGHSNSADIASALNEAKVPRRRGNRPWTGDKVSKLIREIRETMREDLLPFKGRSKNLTDKQRQTMQRVIKLAIAGSRRKAHQDARRLGRIVMREKSRRPFFNNDQIAALLNSRGLSTARGKAWSGSRVESVLRVYKRLHAKR